MYYLPKQISFKHKIIKIVILNRFSLNAGTVKGKSEKILYLLLVNFRMKLNFKLYV